MSPILTMQTQHDKSMKIPRRIGADVAEVQIICHERALFMKADVDNSTVILTAQSLILYGERIETRRTKRCGRFNRKILIDLEFHAETFSGRTITRSRDNSAA